jgi:aldose 1-epimerase
MEPTSSTRTGNQPKIDCVPFGKAPNGIPVDLYRLTNRHGLVATITNYGGIVVSLLVPDRNGKLGDIVLGYDDLAGYLKASPYFGCLVGRYGNRLAKGQFKLDGKTYSLAKNNGENHLHGGLIGFDKVVWSARALTTADGVALELQYLSPDGEEGYPGALSVKATYSLTNANEFTVDYLATTDKPTVLSLTHHSYFNLDGTDRDIRDHILTIHADVFTPVDSGLIPTGELRAVKGTPMDFTRPKAVGTELPPKDPQLAFGRGYDHNFVLGQNPNGPTLAARLEGPRSGRVMEVLTTEPGVQFYSGGHLDGTIVGKQGARYGQYHGLCLETQHYPNSPNQPDFPSTVLRPGETYRSRTIHKFSVAGA